MELLFKFLIIISGFMVFFSTNPVYSVIFLVLVFLNGCGLILLLGFEFLSLVLLVVYVGAISVLFLFVVMMMNLKSMDFRQSLLSYFFLGLTLLIIFFLQLKNIASNPFVWSSGNTFYLDWASLFFINVDIFQLGQVLYTYYCIPFILSGYLLLVAMIGAIFLTYFSKNELKKQKVYVQLGRLKSSSIVYWKR
jgi:NADH-quinone oxidoreductase subunit J